MAAPTETTDATPTMIPSGGRKDLSLCDQMGPMETPNAPHNTMYVCLPERALFILETYQGSSVSEKYIPTVSLKFMNNPVKFGPGPR
jgi:hypothetical protein